MRITEAFEKLSLHDAAVERVERREREIHIFVSGAFVSREHPQGDGRDLVVDKGVLCLRDVTGERATQWLDDKEAKPHPAPEVPVDEIMNASFDGSEFAFDGFLRAESWFEWFIHATSFELEVLESHEHVR